MHAMTSRVADVETDTRISSDNENNAIATTVINNSTPLTKNHVLSETNDQQRHNTETVYLLKAMLNRLDKLVDKENSHQQSLRGIKNGGEAMFRDPSSRIQYEWREIALILDRLFLVLFILLTITMVVCIIIYSQIGHS